MGKKLDQKTLCDWSKSDIEEHLDLLSELVDEPRFVCRKCARSAHSKRQLCKPTPVEKKVRQS